MRLQYAQLSVFPEFFGELFSWFRSIWGRRAFGRTKRHFLKSFPQNSDGEMTIPWRLEAGQIFHDIGYKWTPFYFGKICYYPAPPLLGERYFEVLMYYLVPWNFNYFLALGAPSRANKSWGFKNDETLKLHFYKLKLELQNAAMQDRLSAIICMYVAAKEGLLTWRALHSGRSVWGQEEALPIVPFALSLAWALFLIRLFEQLKMLRRRHITQLGVCNSVWFDRFRRSYFPWRLKIRHFLRLQQIFTGNVELNASLI